MDYGPVTNDSIAANGRACSNWQIKAYFQQAVIVPVTLQRESGDSRSDLEAAYGIINTGQ
ncbi:hypothetical protein M1N02_00880 [Thermodesulfovibrionales bacterium]|nr:hypothetical protein [Thermodesulfovibrionales bacterium]